jgi:pyruvate formate lyase activating enzyme
MWGRALARLFSVIATQRLPAPVQCGKGGKAMHEALLYEPLADGAVGCQACAHGCEIPQGEHGRCGVRVNDGGTLYTQVYGQAASVHIDPIERKPLFHFLPGSKSLSLGTFGCNFRCRFCQNWELSQAPRIAGGMERRTLKMPPHALVEHCVNQGIPCISFTYNEPTVFIEYALDTARLAHDAGLKTNFVTNGYQSQQALTMLAPYLDAANIDLKSLSDGFYREYCGARVQPVLDTIRLAQNFGIWVEVTTLIIPGLNDSDAELGATAEYLADVKRDMPWHVTAFHPDYKLKTLPHTSASSLLRAYELGLRAGLRHVYVGNIIDAEHSTTYCPGCRAALISRSWGGARMLKLADGQCSSCGRNIPGIWA